MEIELTVEGWRRRAAAFVGRNQRYGKEYLMGEFVGLLCSLYLIFMTAVLSLYTGGTYWQLGDTKYILFRNVTLISLGIWLAVTLFSAMRSLVVGQKRFLRLSVMDICMLVYMASALISALCSPYGRISWTGYREWYMGAISQCLFIGIYFFVSRSYDGNKYPVYVGEAALSVVFLIGLANRLGFDPLNLMQTYTVKSWEYSHMISTIGNINWFCGYCSVMLGFPVAGYLKCREKGKKVLLYLISVMGLVLLCIQGSDAGALIAASCIGIVLLYGLNDWQIFRQGLMLAAAMCLGMALYTRLARLLGPEAVAAVPADGIGFDRMAWSGWWIIGALLIVCALLLGRFSAKTAKRAGFILLLLLGLAAAAAAVAYAVKLPAGNGWGSGRGGLWKFAWQGFVQGDLKQKLIGAGPDCFAEYIYSTQPAYELTPTEGFWEGTIYANAHNEWLNVLINQGLLGTAALVGIFAACIKRYKWLPFGILVIAMYGVNSLISFQQVLSTPFLFMALGLCENSMRKDILI